MEFLLFPASGLILAIAIFITSDSYSRRFAFYAFWLAGIICFVLSGLLFLTASGAERYSQILTAHTVFSVLGFIFIVAANLSSHSLGKTVLFSKLIEEKQFRASSEITQLAASNSSLMELLNFSLEKLIGMLSLSGGAIHVFHRARESLVLGSYLGLSPRLARRLETVELGDTAIGRTAKNKRLLIIRDLRLSQDYEFFGGRQEGFSYMALIPIVSEGENWGVITLFGKGPYQPGSLQVDLLEQFGEQLGAALVLGRQVRSMQSSRENFSALLKAMGEELCNVAQAGNPDGAVQNLAWLVTRFFGGDRYDICRKMQHGWKVTMTSDPSVKGKFYQPEIEFVSTGSSSGIVNWDQPPPFKELTRGKAYAFVSLNNREDWFIIRLEGRRRASIELELLTDAFRVILGLHSQLMALNKQKLTKVPGDVRPATRESADAALKLSRISGELGRLIAAYSGAMEKSDLGELFAWLEVIKRSVEGYGQHAIPGSRPGDSSASADMGRIIRGAIDRVTGERSDAPEIIFDQEGDLPMPDIAADVLTQSILEFMSAALFESGSHGVLRLVSTGDDKSIQLELQGENLSQAPRNIERPEWLKRLGARLESRRVESDEGKAVDSWRLVIPLNGSIGDKSSSDPVRILAVDNQEVIRDLLKGMMSNLGYDASVVADSGDALSLFKSSLDSGRPFKIVIADQALDKTSGLDLARELKALDSDVFFVLISGWGPTPDEEASRIGIDAMLKKPFRLEQLSALVETAIKGTVRE